jgi:DNA uptake protein ComE-like DNA-binding protein
MATHTERKALLWIGIIAALGVGVRVWRAHHPSTESTWSSRSSSDTADGDGESRWRESDGQSSNGASHRKRSSNRRSRSPSTSPIDSTSIIDLDQASLEQIEALGVLKAGGARLIIANRDSFGAFGSITEVERIPYLTRSEIRKLARRVTFSSVPRPRNTVMPGRVDPIPDRRKRSP